MFVKANTTFAYKHALDQLGDKFEINFLCQKITYVEIARRVRNQ